MPKKNRYVIAVSWVREPTARVYVVFAASKKEAYKLLTSEVQTNGPNKGSEFSLDSKNPALESFRTMAEQMTGEGVTHLGTFERYIEIEVMS